MKNVRAFCLALSLPPTVKADTGATFVDTISSQYSSSAQKWESSIKGHAAHFFWILAVISAAWTFIQVIIRQPDFADLFGTAMRFVFVTMLFFYLLDHGAGFAGDILRSTNQLAGDATGTRGLDYGAFANMGVKILVEVSSHISMWNGVVAVVAGIIAMLILVVLALITVNLILVNCETWIVLSGGLSFWPLELQNGHGTCPSPIIVIYWP